VPAVKDGRRPSPQEAHSVLDGCEHDATLDQVGTYDTSCRVIGPFRGLSDQPNAGRLRSLPSLDYVDGYALAIGQAGDPRAVQR
jgi:hypothetical protein